MAGILGNAPTASKSGGGILFKKQQEKVSVQGSKKQTLAEQKLHSLPKPPTYSGIDDIAVAKAEKFGTKPISANPFQTPKADPLAKTPIDQRINLFPNNEEVDNRKYIGMNLKQAYKEDTPLQKVGKGIINYGAGGVLSLLGNIGGAAQQGIMQGSRAVANAILGQPQDFREMSFGKDVLGAKEENIGTMALGQLLDPATYIGGGIYDDLSRAGVVGKASKPSTEMVQVLGESQQKLLARQAAKAAKKAGTVVDDIPAIGNKADDVQTQINRLDDYFQQKRTSSLDGKLPKQKTSSGIPIGENPLSFPQTVAKSDLAADELKRMIKDNPLSYKPINNADTLKYAQEVVDQNFEAAKRIVKEGTTFQNATESAMAQDIIRRLQNNKQWDEAFEVMEATARKAKTSGQTIQAFSMWRRMTPEGMLKYADKVINETGGKMTAEFADKLTDAMKRINEATDENTLRNTIMRQAGEMPQWAYKSMNSKTADQLKDIAMAQVLSDVADQVPKSAWRKASSVQAMSHLINAKTAARNVLGNLTFGAAEKVSNAIAAPIDWMASKFTGKRSLTTPKFKGTFKAGFEQAKEAAFDASMGIDRTGVSAGKYNVPIGSSFKGKLGKAGEKLLNYELNVPDEFFKGQIYDDVLKQQMSAAKVTEATQDMIEYATNRAKYATFQDDSLPAKLLQGFKDLSNKIGGGAKIRGKSGLMTREFGLGDFLIKYTTVPGNLISRSIEYTPAGLLKILSIAKDANLSGAMKQSEIAMTIGRTITGTSMIAMGAALRRKGLIISEDKDRSKNAQSLDQAEGLGNYKVNVSAIERILNGEDTSLQDGDLLYSYNWIEPLGVQLAIGAEIDKEMQKQGTVPEIAFNAGNAAMEEILDLPTLSVIRQITYQDNVFDKAITPLVQGVSGFVPGPVRQYAQYQDPVSRLTKGEGWQDKITNRLKSSLPSIGSFEGRKGLEPKIDPFGREVQYPGGLFNTMFNPGQASAYRPSEVTPQLKQLEDLTGQTDFYPRDSAPNNFSHKKQPITLTPEEKTLYMQIEGKEVLRRYKEILAKGVSSANAEQQRAALNKAKTKASKMAKDEILKRRGLK